MARDLANSLHTRGSGDDLDNISVCLVFCLFVCLFFDEDNDLEEEITHLFNEVSISIFKFEKQKQKQNQSGNQVLNIPKT